MSEICRNCGKEIKIAFNRWWHLQDGGPVNVYCFRVHKDILTKDILSKAEPFSKNDIVYGILKEI